MKCNNTLIIGDVETEHSGDGRVCDSCNQFFCFDCAVLVCLDDSHNFCEDCYESLEWNGFIKIGAEGEEWLQD